jgi:hypothetical protein
VIDFVVAILRNTQAILGQTDVGIFFGLNEIELEMVLKTIKKYANCLK